MCVCVCPVSGLPRGARSAHVHVMIAHAGPGGGGEFAARTAETARPEAGRARRASRWRRGRGSRALSTLSLLFVHVVYA